MPTDTLGTATVEVTPYFMIADNIEYISDQQITLGYYVKKDFNCATDGCLYGKCQVTGQCTTVVQIAENIPKNCSASCPGGSCINDTCYQKVLIPNDSIYPLWIAILVLIIIIILIIIGFSIRLHK